MVTQFLIHCRFVLPTILISPRHPVLRQQAVDPSCRVFRDRSGCVVVQVVDDKSNVLTHVVNIDIVRFESSSGVW